MTERFLFQRCDKCKNQLESCDACVKRCRETLRALFPLCPKCRATEALAEITKIIEAEIRPLSERHSEALGWAMGTLDTIVSNPLEPCAQHKTMEPALRAAIEHGDH